MNAKRTAELENVDIRLHRIIYKVIEEIEAAMQGMLDPEFEEKVIGQAEVRQTFKVTKVGTIAGCYVTDGKITRDSGVRIIRDGVVIFEGQLDTLKRFKDDVKRSCTKTMSVVLQLRDIMILKKGTSLKRTLWKK